MTKNMVELLQEINKIFYFCKQPYDKDPEILLDRITILVTYLARSAEIYADVQFEYDKKLGDEAEKLSASYSPMKAKDILKGKVAIEARTLMLSQRLNATITHQLDAIRSQLSFIKADIFNNN